MTDSPEAEFELFHFRPRYTLEVDPEFPGDGQWGCPVFGFDRHGRVTEHFDSRWGAPLIVRVHPAPAQDWVGMFAAGGLGGLSGVFACPSTSGLCAVVDGEAYLVEVEHPDSGTVIAHDQVRQVVAVEGADLLLLVRFIDIVAIGTSGIAWRSARLVVDDLEVIEARVETISLTGDMLGSRPTIRLDPSSGAVVDGPRLGPPWN